MPPPVPSRRTWTRMHRADVLPHSRRRKGELFIVATTSYLSSYLERWIDGLL